MDGERAQLRPDAVIATVAAGQHGLVSCRQLLTAGIGRGAIEHRLRTGRLIGVHRGVYAVGHLHDSSEVRRMAAVLACGDGAVLSHHSAGAHWELRPSSALRIDVTVAGRAGRRARRGIVVHRSTDLPPAEVTNHRGIPVTTVARTLLGLAATVQVPSLNRTVERSDILELFDLAAVQSALARHPNHPGAASRARRSTFCGPTSGWSSRLTAARRTSPALRSSAIAQRTHGSLSPDAASSASPTARSDTARAASPRRCAPCSARVSRRAFAEAPVGTG